MAETCTLIVITNGKDDDGFPVEIREEFEAYVLKEKSVRSSEFYEAYATGMDVRLILELRIEEWEQSMHIVDGVKEYATKVAYDGGTYDVAREYRKNKSVVELTLASGKKVTAWR